MDNGPIINVLICVTTVIVLKIQMVTLQMVFNFVSKYRFLFIQITLLTVMLDWHLTSVAQYAVLHVLV